MKEGTHDFWHFNYRSEWNLDAWLRFWNTKICMMLIHILCPLCILFHSLESVNVEQVRIYTLRTFSKFNLTRAAVLHGLSLTFFGCKLLVLFEYRQKCKKMCLRTFTSEWNYHQGASLKKKIHSEMFLSALSEIFLGSYFL